MNQIHRHANLPYAYPIMKTVLMHSGKNIYRGEHHEVASIGILVLQRPLPVLLDPLGLDQETEILVREGGGRTRPRPSVSAAVRVAATKGVGAEQSDNLLVVEAHAVEYLPER